MDENYLENQMPDVDPWEYDSKKYTEEKHKTEEFLKRDSKQFYDADYPQSSYPYDYQQPCVKPKQSQSANKAKPKERVYTYNQTVNGQYYNNQPVFYDDGKDKSAKVSSQVNNPVQGNYKNDFQFNDDSFEYNEMCNGTETYTQSTPFGKYDINIDNKIADVLKSLLFSIIVFIFSIIFRDSITLIFAILITVNDIKVLKKGEYISLCITALVVASVAVIISAIGMFSYNSFLFL